jgi:hypothetical protein
VNGERKARFTVSFTGPFTSKAILSHTEYIACARQDDGFGRGQNSGLGWSDPQNPIGVAPAQLGKTREIACRVLESTKPKGRPEHIKAKLPRL